MSEQEIIDGNLLIAKFMINSNRDIVYPSGSIGAWIFDRGEDELIQFIKKTKYNKSWDWLMPVIEKIEDLDFNNRVMSIKTKSSYWVNL